MRVLLIIPAYNEAENLPKLVETVENFAARQTGFALDYIIVNDGSADQTAALCRENRWHALHLARNLGIGGAVQTGYLLARQLDYDIAVQFDGDGQHDIASLPTLLAPILAGEADFVLGSRFVGESSGFRSTALRRAGIRLLSAMIRLVTGVTLADPTSGYRAAAKPAIAALAKSYPVDYPEPESLAELLRAGFRVREVPVNMFERAHGASSISPVRSVWYMIKVSLAILCTGLQGKGAKE